MAQPAERRLRHNQPVVSGEACQRQLEDDLGRPLRPTVVALGRFQPDVVTAHGDEYAGEFRPHRLQRPVEPLPGGNHMIAELHTYPRRRARRAPAGRGT
jgi:hypothetical protein